MTHGAIEWMEIHCEENGFREEVGLAFGSLSATLSERPQHLIEPVVALPRAIGHP